MMLDIAAAYRQFEGWQSAILRAEDRMATFSGNAIVAGGAVRDTLLGRPVKDIDVFHDLPLENVEGLERVLPKNPSEEIEHRYDSKTVWTSLTNKLDFILIGDYGFSNYITSKFRCNLSKVWYDGSQLHIHPEFAEALRRER